MFTSCRAAAFVGYGKRTSARPAGKGGRREAHGKDRTAGGAVRWRLSDRFDPVANAIAKRHYNSQTPDSDQWVKPGACICLRTIEGDAVWSSSAPKAEFTQHAWAGLWECSTFRNESPHLSSELIREAVAVTLGEWGEPPDDGMVTFVNPELVRHKRDPGRCFLRAGFEHAGWTKGGLRALVLAPGAMPAPAQPLPWKRGQGVLLFA